VKKAESFFGGEPFVLANCDFITDVDLSPIIQRHSESGALATMVLFQDEKLQPLYSKVGVDGEGLLCALPACQTRPPAQTGIFTGIHVLENEVLAHLQAVPCGINEILYPHLMRENPKRVRAEFMRDHYWYDTGDCPAIWTASMRLLERLTKGDRALRELVEKEAKLTEKRPGIWIPVDTALPKGIELAPPVMLASGCRIDEGAKLGPVSIVAEGAQIGQGARVSNFIALGAVHVPAKEVVDGVLQFGKTRLPLKKGPR
jgi:NDP-sugar pyrophosphorylase family protein